MLNNTYGHSRGFTLVNILMAMLIISIAVVGGMKALLIAKKQMTVTSEYRSASNILQNLNDAMKNANTNTIALAPMTLSAADCSAPSSLQLQSIKNFNQAMFVKTLLNNLSCQLHNANANGVMTITKDAITYQCHNRQHCINIIF